MRQRALELALKAAPIEDIGQRIDLRENGELGELRACGRELALKPCDLGGKLCPDRTCRPLGSFDPLDRPALQ
jgi:hypothetical protein